MLTAASIVLLLWTGKIAFDVVKQKRFLFSEEGSVTLFYAGIISLILYFVPLINSIVPFILLQKEHTLVSIIVTTGIVNSFYLPGIVFGILGMKKFHIRWDAHILAQTVFRNILMMGLGAIILTAVIPTIITVFAVGMTVGMP